MGHAVFPRNVFQDNAFAKLLDSAFQKFSMNKSYIMMKLRNVRSLSQSPGVIVMRGSLKCSTENIALLQMCYDLIYTLHSA
jgi:hypothetical protein